MGRPGFRCSVTAIAAGTALGLACLLVVGAWHGAMEGGKRVLAIGAEGVRENVSRNLGAAEEVLSNLGTLMNSSTHVDGDQFRVFSEEILRRHPFLIATGYFQLSHDRERDEFEASMRSRGFPTFSITERRSGEYRAASRRERHLPLVYLEPFEPSRAVMVGFDALSEPRFAKAIDAAVATAEVRFAPARDKDEFTTGAWLFRAVFAGKTLPRSFDQRRRLVNGLVALGLDTGRLLALSVGDTGLSARLWIEGEPERIAEKEGPPLPGPLGRLATFRQEHVIAVAGERYRLALERPVSWGDIDRVEVAAALLIALVILSTLPLAARSFSLRIREKKERQAEIERLVDVRTAELAQSNRSLKQEVHERQHAEKALGESEARFRELFDNMSSGVAMYRPSNPDAEDFNIVGFNRAAERFEGVRREDIIGRRVTEVFPGIREFGLLDVFRRVWNTGVGEHVPAALYQDDRLSGWKENYVYKLPSGEVVAVYDDVTERKRVEEDLRHAQKMEAIGTLAGGIAHDFNNILTSILGCAELTVDLVPSGGRARRNLDIILKSGRRAAPGLQDDIQ
ncbi:MAG: CHASE domain-containing protein, partial [Proteobacteria bacterium]|nr:CHASE domain-containing protein [Pseudomonadota bacterium]